MCRSGRDPDEEFEGPSSDSSGYFLVSFFLLFLSHIFGNFFLLLFVKKLFIPCLKRMETLIKCEQIWQTLNYVMRN